jgi:hypothetical protein
MVIIFVPLMVVRVLHIADIMAVCQRPVMIYYTTKIVLAGDVIHFQEVVVLDEVAQVQVVQRKLDHGLKLTPYRANSFETFQLYRQNRRRSENLE